MGDISHSPIGIIGGGRVGQTLGRALREHGEPVAWVADQSIEQAAAAIRHIGSGIEAVTAPQIAGGPYRVLIAVPDRAVEVVAEELALQSGIVLHTCGIKGPEALEPLRRRMVPCGVLHPLQTFPAPAGSEVLHGITFGISGDPEAVAWAGHIASLACGRALCVRTGAMPLYHAAAAMASNYVVSTLSAAQALMEAAGVAPGEVFASLEPLVRAAVDNVMRLGPVAALTGPVQRGDTATVRAHLDALDGVPCEINALYRAAAAQALVLARQRGLADGAVEEIGRLLNS